MVIFFQSWQVLDCCFLGDSNVTFMHQIGLPGRVIQLTGPFNLWLSHVMQIIPRKYSKQEENAWIRQPTSSICICPFHQEPNPKMMMVHKLKKLAKNYQETISNNCFALPCPAIRAAGRYFPWGVGVAMGGAKNEHRAPSISAAGSMHDSAANYDQAAARQHRMKRLMDSSSMLKNRLFHPKLLV